MSQFGYEYDDDQGQQDNPRGLRKQLEDMAAKISERDAQIAELTKTVQMRNVVDTLAELKVPNAGKVAKLVPQDIAGDAEKVKGWVTEFGDVFAATSASSEASAEKPDADEQQSNQKPDVDAETMAAFQRTQTAEGSAGTTNPDLEAQHLAQLNAIFQAANGSSDQFISLLESGGLKQP